MQNSNILLGPYAAIGEMKRHMRCAAIDYNSLFEALFMLLQLLQEFVKTVRQASHLLEAALRL